MKAVVIRHKFSEKLVTLRVGPSESSSMESGDGIFSAVVNKDGVATRSYSLPVAELLSCTFDDVES